MGKAILVPNVTFEENLGKVTTDSFVFNAAVLSVKQEGQCSPQGAAVYGDYLFYFSNNQSSTMIIRNIRDNSLIQNVVVQEENNSRHSNSMCFGHLKYDESDDFPLLYAGGNLGDLINTVDVYRVTKSGNVFSITRAQTIDISNFGYCDVAYWEDKLVLVRGTYVYLVNPPSANESTPVLDSNNIVVRFKKSQPRPDVVGPVCVGDYIFIPYFRSETITTPSIVSYYYNILQVMNLRTGDVVAEIEFNYNNDYRIEYEQILYWDNKFILLSRSFGSYILNFCCI